MHSSPSLKKEAAQPLSVVAEKMLTAYALDCGINKRGESGIPSKREIERIIRDLLIVLFPGYLGDMPVPDVDAQAYVMNAMESLSKHLRKAIGRTVLYSCKLGSRCPPETAEVDADGVVDGLLQKLTSIRANLAMDVEAAFSGDPAARSCEEVIACYPSILAISIHRVAHELYLAHVPLIPRMMSEFAHSATGIDIHPGEDRAEVLRRPRNRDGHRGDRRGRKQRQALSGSHSGRPQPAGEEHQEPSGSEKTSDVGGRRNRLLWGDDPRGRDGDRQGLHHRRERVDHIFCAA